MVSVLTPSAPPVHQQHQQGAQGSIPSGRRGQGMCACSTPGMSPFTSTAPAQNATTTGTVQPPQLAQWEQRFANLS